MGVGKALSWNPNRSNMYMTYSLGISKVSHFVRSSSMRFTFFHLANPSVKYRLIVGMSASPGNW
ncbi:hypothetical protein PHLH4_43280 [Pseudomonas sp. St316]|nr:hypothetical protein PHLH4_43280 [Pseudomonas sp. St316]